MTREAAEMLIEELLDASNEYEHAEGRDRFERARKLLRIKRQQVLDALVGTQNEQLRAALEEIAGMTGEADYGHADIAKKALSRTKG